MTSPRTLGLIATSSDKSANGATFGVLVPTVQIVLQITPSVPPSEVRTFPFAAALTTALFARRLHPVDVVAVKVAVEGPQCIISALFPGIG